MPQRAARALSWIGSAALAWICASAVGCAGLPPPPRTAHAWNEMLPGLASDVPPTEALRVGDKLIIAVGDGTAAPLEHTAWIEGNGRAHVAQGQDVEVAGVDIKRAEERVAAALRVRDRFAVVDLRLDTDATRNATVIGAVGEPGAVALTPAMRVADVIASAGGLAPTRMTRTGLIVPSPADLGAAKVLRDGRALPIDVTRALAGEVGHNVYVYPGDIIYVPYVESQGVAVFGQVNGAGVVPYRTGLRLTEALAVSRGLTSWADGEDVRVIRGPADKPVAYKASVDAFFDGERRDVRVLPGDTVFVQDEPLEEVYEVVNIFAPIVGIASSFMLTSILLLQ